MSNADAAQAKRSWLIPLVVLLILGVVLCGGPITWWTWRRSNAFGTLQQRREALLERGQPIDDQSLAALRIRLMDRQDSERWMAVLEQLDAEAYQQAALSVPIVGAPEDEQPYVPGQPYRHDAEVRAFLQRTEDLRREIHAITEGSGAIWTEIEFDSFNTLLPYVQAARSVSRLIALEFDDAVRRDDGKQVYRSLRSLIGIARTVEQEPIIVSQLVHLALTGIALDKIKVAVERDLLDDQQLATLSDELRPLDDFGRRYRLAVSGERAMSQPVFDDLGRLGEQSANIPTSLNRRPIDAIASLDLFARAAAIADDDLDVFFREAVAEEERFVREVEQAGWLRRFDTLLTELLTPAIGAFGKAVVRNAMSVRLAKLGVAIRRFEKQTGRLPEEIGELTESFDLGPVQPIGGKPFGYRLTDGTAELWGFNPEQPGDHTPPQPAVPSDERDDQPFWHWTIPAAETNRTDRPVEQGDDRPVEQRDASALSEIPGGNV